MVAKVCCRFLYFMVSLLSLYLSVSIIIYHFFVFTPVNIMTKYFHFFNTLHFLYSIVSAIFSYVLRYLIQAYSTVTC